MPPKRGRQPAYKPPSEQQILETLAGSVKTAGRFIVQRPTTTLDGYQYAIGKGSFGLIFLAKDNKRPSVPVVALKIEDRNAHYTTIQHEYWIVRESVEELQKKKRRVERIVPWMELEALLVHPVDSNIKLDLIVMPAWPTTVNQFLQKHGKSKLSIHDPVFQRLAAECMRALEELHQGEVIHMDIKLDNIMIHWAKDGKSWPSLQDFQVVLIDYGLAATVQKLRLLQQHPRAIKSKIGMDVQKGTSHFASLCAYDENCTQCYVDDLQALGFCLWELCVDYLPWENTTQHYLMKRKFLSGEENYNCPLVLQKFLRLCYQMERSLDELPDYNMLLRILKETSEKKHAAPSQQSPALPPPSPVPTKLSSSASSSKKKGASRKKAPSSSHKKEKKKKNDSRKKSPSRASSPSPPPSVNMTIVELKSKLTQLGVAYMPYQLKKYYVDLYRSNIGD